MMFNVFGREAVSRRDVAACLCRAEDFGHVRLAQARCQLDQRIDTARRSKVERLMTLSTSAVAVCCCKNSVSSRVRALRAGTGDVSNRDYRLVGKGLEQHNVLIGERRDAVSGHHDCSYGSTVV